jgi:magnesium chelatase subunit H
MRFVILTVELSQAPALQAAAAEIRRQSRIDLQLTVHNVPLLRGEADWARLGADIAAADLVFGTMLFGEEYVRPLVPLLQQATVPVCMIMSNPALIRCTRLGKFDLRPHEDDQQPGLLRRWMAYFKPSHGHGEVRRQLNLFRGMTRMLKYLPGKARDLHSYIAVHQYWASSSPENLRRMLALLIERYLPGYQGKLKIEDPLEYPDEAIWHPAAPAPFAERAAYDQWHAAYLRDRKRRANATSGTVGLLTLRSIALGGNTAHLSALVDALEQRGLDVRLAYSRGLDGRSAIEQFFMRTEKTGRKRKSAEHAQRLPDVDLLVTTTGFGLVGGPAEARPDEARAALELLDRSYLDFLPLAFQRIEEWRASPTGLSPMQMALNIALPELEGAVEPLIFGGPAAGSDRMQPLTAEIERGAERIARRVALHRKANAEKKLAVVLFSFPPNLGNAGTAAYLDVFASMYRLLGELKAQGYHVDLPSGPEALRRQVTEGNQLLHGTDGNVAATLDVADYRRLFPQYAAIEPFWGTAPGELLTDGKRFYVLGAQFGHVFVGIQPSFGYERDPMRLLMAKDAAPHHGFAAFYTWLAKVFGADAVLHFGTHGALEFMPGKQVGLSADCWPARLLGGLPNVYYYCVNNPSEGTIARRRGAATLVSYLVPPVQHAGLYKGLRLLKDHVDRYRAGPDAALLEDIRTQAEQLGIRPAPADAGDEAYVTALNLELLQVEQRLIPVGLHVLGRPPELAERVDVLALVAAFARPAPEGAPPAPTLPEAIAAGLGFDYAALNAGLKHDPLAQERWQQVERLAREAVTAFVTTLAEQGSAAVDVAAARADAVLQAAPVPAGRMQALWQYLGDILARMLDEQELTGLLRGLAGHYIAPSPGNDIVRNPAVVPTGRNIHGLDPFHIPSAKAQANGVLLARELLERSRAETGAWPETVAMVLWGTDNIKTDGEGVAQALALVGARALSDELGHVASVELIPLAELGRPRIDVVITVSGIFRDLLGRQTELIDRAIHMAAAADEPPEQNFVRRHALAQAAELGLSLDEAAARIFANAPGNYGANVNYLVESSSWDESSQISDTFMARKGFVFGAGGTWQEARPLMERALATVDVTFQNIDSVENGISDIDHYFEYLGGLSKSVENVRGKKPAVLMGEVEVFAGPAGGRVRSLEQLVRLESRAKLLNPRWFEGMLQHGYEGVHELEIRLSNTYGWSATADAVEGWVYQGVAETFLLDEAMRRRLAEVNPHATAAMAGRLLEASNRGFWDADEQTLESLREIYADLEDRLEGVSG